jgi:hypothetical protein
VSTSRAAESTAPFSYFGGFLKSVLERVIRIPIKQVVQDQYMNLHLDLQLQLQLHLFLPECDLC